jgi:hypothetical protein
MVILSVGVLIVFIIIFLLFVMNSFHCKILSHNFDHSLSALHNLPKYVLKGIYHEWVDVYLFSRIFPLTASMFSKSSLIFKISNLFSTYSEVSPTIIKTPLMDVLDLSIKQDKLIGKTYFAISLLISFVARLQNVSEFALISQSWNRRVSSVVH